MEKRGHTEPIDLDKITATLEPEANSDGGLFVPGKDRVVFRPPERKSLLGLDVLAIAKREGSKVNGGFKTPRERGANVVSSMEEDEKSESVISDEKGTDEPTAIRSHSRRRYREISGSETPRTESTVTEELKIDDMHENRYSREHMRGNVSILLALYMCFCFYVIV